MKVGSNAVITITVDDLNSSIDKLEKKKVHFIGDI